MVCYKRSRVDGVFCPQRTLDAPLLGRIYLDTGLVGGHHTWRGCTNLLNLDSRL